MKPGAMKWNSERTTRWGLKWAMGERRENEIFHPGRAVLGLRACFDPGDVLSRSSLFT